MDVRVAGEPVRLTGERQRALLALLVLNRGGVVSSDRLVDGLWGERPPPGVANALQAQVARLRKALGRDRVLTSAGGYQLVLEGAVVDVLDFERLLRQAEGAPAPETARLLGDALALYRGDPLGEFRYEPFAQAEIARLEELRLAACEGRIEAELALGRDRELVAELERLVAEQPLRERLRAQLMLALYRSGRQADALQAYQDARRALVDELGLEPGVELQELNRAVLNQDPALALPAQEAVAPSRLPVAPTPLVGRERELAEAGALLRDHAVRLVTLIGPGGVGKTRLALALAEALAPELDHGAVFVDLSPLNGPGLVGQTIARALDLREAPDEPLADRLLAYLRPRAVLLVLDNFENVVESAPLVGRLLAEAPAVRALVTSRVALALAGERRYPVPTLGTDDAVALFVARARAVRPSFDDDAAVVEICRRLDGLPLAIELAAARVRALEPDAILQRLERRLELVTGGPRDAPARQRDLRATLDWSHELLNDAERRLFAMLGIFVGGFTLQGAEAVAGATLDQIESLVDKSLVHYRDGRFHLLETIREYAVDRIDTLGVGAEVRRRHAEHFAAQALLRALAARQSDAEALRWYDEEQENLRAAFAYARETAQHELVAELLRGTWVVFAVRGRLGEGLSWAEELLPRLDSLEPSVRASAELAVGEMVRHAGQLQRAIALKRSQLASLKAHPSVSRQPPGKSAAIAPGDSAAPLVAALHADLADMLARVGELGEARAHLEAALRLRQQIGEPLGVAHAQLAATVVHFQAGDYDAARTLAATAARVYAAAEFDFDVTYCELVVGASYRREGDLAAARTHLGLAFEIASCTGDVPGLADVLAEWAGIELAGGDAARAAVVLGASERLRFESATPFNDEQDVRRTRAALRGALGDVRFASSRATGAAMSVSQIGTFMASTHPE